MKTRRSKRLISSVLALFAGILLSGTAVADTFSTAVGGGIGAVAGAVIGDSVGGRNGAIIGSGVGGAIGAVVGQSVSEPARGGYAVAAPAYERRVYYPVREVHYVPAYAPTDHPGHGRGHAKHHHRHHDHGSYWR